MTAVFRALPSPETQIRLTDGGDGGNDFTKLELVQDGRLTSSVETDLQRKFRSVWISKRSIAVYQ